MNARIPKNALLWLLLLIAMAACKDPCKDNSCLHGACLEGDCICNAGWTGVHCDERDQCYQRTCVNGYCADGSCVCDAGYEGNTCATPVNVKFAGNYAVTQTCDNSGPGGYSAILQVVDGNVSQFRITNLYNAGNVIAMIGDDGHTFSIALQALDQNVAAQATSGTMSADARTITLSFTVSQISSGNPLDKCTAVLTKY